MNQVTVAGHLGADPEVRFTSSGLKVTTLRVAARVRRGKKDETIWWRVSVWGEQFDKMISFLKKGSPVVVVGEMNKPEIFTDRDGKPQVSMSMTAFNVMFSPFGKQESSPSQAGPAASAQPAKFQEVSHEVSYGTGDEASFADEEVPF